jgi:glycosyltransferase involved in cell wall biosynthesis
MTNLIATDSRWLGNHGIGRYASEVLSRLPEITPLNLRGSPTSPIDPVRLSLALHHQKPKIFYNPGFNCPILPYPNAVLTIHDLIHLADSGQRSLVKTLYYQKLLKPFLLKSPFIFTVSEQSKQQILEWTHLPPSRVIVTPNGVSDEFRPNTYQKKEQSFLYIGSSRSHKNTQRMLEAFSLLSDSELRLNWVGPISNDDKHLIQRLKIGHRLQFHLNLSNQQLAALYQKSLGTILVSTFEGFGLPPIESIFSGTPAIISNNSPLVDDLFRLAIVVDPFEVDSIRDGLQRLQKQALDTQNFLQIAELKKKYNWTNTASIVHENLKRLL